MQDSIRRQGRSNGLNFDDLSLVRGQPIADLRTVALARAGSNDPSMAARAGALRMAAVPKSSVSWRPLCLSLSLVSDRSKPVKNPRLQSRIFFIPWPARKPLSSDGIEVRAAA